jgi:regulator of sigma E protease
MPVCSYEEAMPDIVMLIVAFVVLLGPLILIHEFGHYIAARMVGVTVLEFGIGFPPRAMKLFERAGTEFTLNWLPIGGFVRPLGEDGSNSRSASRNVPTSKSATSRPRA